MVDFKKLLNNRRHNLPTRTIPKQGDCELRDCTPVPPSPRSVVLETSLHREMRDPDYLRSLDVYADAHRTQ